MWASLTLFPSSAGRSQNDFEDGWHCLLPGHLDAVLQVFCCFRQSGLGTKGTRPRIQNWASGMPLRGFHDLSGLSFLSSNIKRIDKSLSLKSFLPVPVKDYRLPISFMIEQFWLQLLQYISIITRIIFRLKDLKELRPSINNFTPRRFIPIWTQLLTDPIYKYVSFPRKCFAWWENMMSDHCSHRSAEGPEKKTKGFYTFISDSVWFFPPL